MDPITEFQEMVGDNIAKLGEDADLQALSRIWLREVTPYRYAYNFTWLGRPIIQVPQDIVALQEIIWNVQPDLIIETGIAHGGSLIFSASLLELNFICGGSKDAEVLGIDIDIRAHNREAIEAHPMSKRISLIQGSSIDPDIIQQVKAKTANKQKVLVCLDSNHTHDHVIAELQAYAPLTSVGSYCIVFDTLIEDMPDAMFGDRPWGPGDNPKTAVWKYLQSLKENEQVAQDGKPLNFVIDQSVDHKLLISVAPDGYLKRIS
jgi:cephalosporin hydroxylase